MTGPPRITVSMPYWRCPATVRRAVDAVLAQTHTALTLLLINDGDTTTPPWPAVADVDDPRLVRVELPANRGRYYCDAVALAAADTDWFAIHDADDHAEPQWLETLLAAAQGNGWDAAFAPQIIHGLTGNTQREDVALVAAGTARRRMLHLAHHAAVYRTAALRAVGGPHPGYRIGYDTLLVNMVALNGPVGAVAHPLYHRVARPGSLTRARATGMRSLTRRRVRAQLERLYAAALDRPPGEVIAADVPADLAAQVHADAAALAAGLLAPRPVNERADNIGAAATPAGGALAGYGWGGWALDRHTANELAAALARHSPKTVVECGSGGSTLLLAEYARATGATVVSLEHAPPHRRNTAQLLAAAGLEGHVRLELAPLTRHPTPRGALPFYTALLPDGIDFALVDGPPGTVGRTATLYALHPRLAPGGGWQVWLDDADRPAEREALAAWRADLGVSVQHVALPKGLAVITAGPAPAPPVDAGDVVVSVLTGRRPDLLEGTVNALQAAAPGLLESAWVTVLHNGADPPTAALLDGWPWIDDRLEYSELPMLPHGPASSTVLRHAAAHAATVTGRRYVLHLEDDWTAATAAPGWLDTARAVLADPGVGQVRLRHRGDPVRDFNMVTGEPIVWRQELPGILTGRAHYTLNPGLMRAEDVPRVWPAHDERHAMARFEAWGRLAAQLDPGVFRHSGGAASLHPGRRW